MMRYISLFLAFIFALCWLTDSAATTGIQGVGVHILGGSRDVARSLEAASNAGFASIRDDAPWAKVEARKGVYKIPENWDRVVDEAKAKGVAVLLILDYGNPLYDNGDKPRSEAAIDAYVAYAEFVVRHFKGRVHQYEIWNEWDSTTGHTSKGTAEDYDKLVRKAYPAIKAIDSQAQILVGAVTADGLERGFAEQLADLGTLDHADGLSIHPYIKCRMQHSPADWANWMAKIDSSLRWRTGKTIPIYVTEMGWPTFAGDCGFSETAQADFAEGLFEEARSLPFIKGVWWYDLQDDGTDPKEREYHYGLIRSDFSPKPAYNALRNAWQH